MENPQRVIYACAILVAGSCPVSQTLSTPSLPPSLPLQNSREEEEEGGKKIPLPGKERRDETRRERERVRGVEKRRRRRWGGEKEEGGGDCAILSLLVTPLSSCRGYNATLKYRRKYKGGEGMKEWKDEIWKRRKEGKRERERRRACVCRATCREGTRVARYWSRERVTLRQRATPFPYSYPPLPPLLRVPLRGGL